MSKKSDAKSVLTVPSWMLLTTIFITGNIIMMLEVVGTRVVGPYFGVGIYVWSALITVALLALAGGYWWGGKLADRYKKPEWLYLAILLAGGLVLLLPLLRVPILSLAGTLGLRVGVLAGSTVLFGPPLFILGMVSPYAAKLFTHQFEKLGSKVGLLYAISTVGSFMGTIIMGFFLIPLFSITVILLSLGVVLIFIPLVYFFLVRKRNLPALGLLLLLLAFSFLVLPAGSTPKTFPSGARLIYHSNSFYGDIKVLQIGHHRTLLVNGVTQSGVDSSTMEATPQYVKDMGLIIKRFHPAAKSVLLVGLGGGNMVHLLKDQGLSIDVVEIDKKIKEVAVNYFDLNLDDIDFHLNDGRRFIKQSQQSYDIIILNTFSGESFPSHLLTKEFFQEVRAKLAPKGVLLLNFVGYVTGSERTASSAAVRATVGTAFNWVYSYFREPKHRFSNILFAAGNDPVPSQEQVTEQWASLAEKEVTIPNWEQAVICSDEYNPIEFLHRRVNKDWRDLVMRSLGPDILLQ